MNKKTWIWTAAALIIAVLLFVIWSLNRPQTYDGEKNFTVEVVHKDGTEKKFQYSTDEKYLGPALLEEKLIEGSSGQYGLYVESVDGEKAEYGNDQAYWKLQINGVDAQAGADSTPVEEDALYTWTYTVAE